ncbi:MAG TPA: TIGR00730 family Rossman fold protein, partial [Blastocatellia bacterium]|nr:TIGR00730 family Rossman fold protein [Blastocatellia bacterium]
MIKRICVFCGSLSGARDVYGEQARALGRAMAERGIGLVFGGGGIGMMGAVADAVIEAKGEVIGVIPYALATKERAHPDVDMRVVNTMHERKAMMAELSDAFIAMPGGFGTFEEVMETITWGQLGIHRKPVGLFNVAGYYDPLLAMIDRAIDEGFIRP